MQPPPPPEMKLSSKKNAGSAPVHNFDFDFIFYCVTVQTLYSIFNRCRRIAGVEMISEQENNAEINKQRINLEFGSLFSVTFKDDLRQMTKLWM